MAKIPMNREIRLKCACVEPFHFVHFSYGIDPKDGLLDYFQIKFQAYNGSLWKRMITATQLIFSGWISGEPDWTCLDRAVVRQLRDFCDKCLDETKDWDDPLKREDE